MPSPEPYQVRLGGVSFNGVPDANGIIWHWDALDGWFASPEVLSAESDTSPDGIVVTAARNLGRPISLSGTAAIPFGQPDLWFTAVHDINAATNFLTTAGLLRVDEPIPLQARVRRTGPPKTAMHVLAQVLQFQVPLKAADPRKYTQALTTDTTLVLTGSATSVTSSILVPGTVDTPWVATIDGPATQPRFTIPGLGFVQWNNTLGGGDTLVIDSSNRTILLNGGNSYPDIGPDSTWHYLPTGTTAFVYQRTGGSGTSTCTLTFRPAYI